MRCATLFRFAWVFLCVGNATAAIVPVIEYYNSSQDHYFITSLQADITALDTGKFTGWSRTGRSFQAYDQPTAGASPVCRFYLPPAEWRFPFLLRVTHRVRGDAGQVPRLRGGIAGGDVHRPARSDDRRRATGSHSRSIACGTTAAIRTIAILARDRQLRQQMVAEGWVAEGYGPDQVIMCSPRLDAAGSSCCRLAPAPTRASPCRARRTGCTCGIPTIARPRTRARSPTTSSARTRRCAARASSSTGRTSSRKRACTTGPRSRRQRSPTPMPGSR